MKLIVAWICNCGEVVRFWIYFESGADMNADELNGKGERIRTQGRPYDLARYTLS